MLSRRSVLGLAAGVGLRGQTRKHDMFGDAEAYERFMGRWSRLLAPLLVDLGNPEDANRVLDVGSGTGVLAFAIAEKRPRCEVQGIDPSKEYVEFARSRSRFGERVKFEVGDAQQLSFGDATFQSSLSLLVFNLIPDREKALREVTRVTMPGGLVAAAVWDYGADMQMLRIFWDAAAAINPAAARLDQAKMPLCRRGELGELWKKGGLVRIEERPLDIDMRFTSIADYWDAFQLGQGPAGAYVAKIGQSERDALRAEVVRRLGTRSDGDAFTLRGRAWAVRGWRRS